MFVEYNNLMVKLLGLWMFFLAALSLMGFPIDLAFWGAIILACIAYLNFEEE